MKTFLLAGLLFAQLPASVRKDPIMIPQGFLTGEDYLKDYSNAERAAYAVGFINGLLVSPLIPPNNTEEWAEKLRICVTSRTNTQYAEIIRKYIDANPKTWNERLNTLSFRAVQDSCKPD